MDAIIDVHGVRVDALARVVKRDEDVLLYSSVEFRGLAAERISKRPRHLRPFVFDQKAFALSRHLALSIPLSHELSRDRLTLEPRDHSRSHRYVARFLTCEFSQSHRNAFSLGFTNRLSARETRGSLIFNHKERYEIPIHNVPPNKGGTFKGTEDSGLLLNLSKPIAKRPY